MKILIFSDSHGDSVTMCGVVDKEQPDMIIYLGDGIADAEEASQKYPNIQMIKNLGNIDSKKEDEEWIKYAEICGKRFMMTHGHTFFIEKEITQGGMEEARLNILKLMYENNIDITLHGHIHEPFIYYHCLTQSKHSWIMCPGRIGRKVNYIGSVNPIYGVLKIRESGALEWQFVEVEQ
jgi:putative phosphoesterase